MEDDSSVREIIRDALRMDYRVLEASCYAEAAPHFDTSFQLALIDYMLPDCDGFDIARTVRVKKPLLPIIVMTAFNQASDERKQADTFWRCDMATEDVQGIRVGVNKENVTGE